MDKLPSHRSSQRRLRNRVDYGPSWPRIRRAYLAAHPWCESAECRGAPRPAAHVDHKVPHVPGEPHKWGNLQALCASCHSKKTVATDGGFGRQKIYETREGGGASS